MNKKVLTGFALVFVLSEIMMFLIHGVLLASTYEANKALFRPDMESLMWIYHVLAIVGSFFFTFVFSKGYEGKGLMEGVRYGLYIGIWMGTGMAYGTYSMMAIPYSLALQWFFYSIVECIVYGIALTMIFGKQAMVTRAAS